MATGATYRIIANAGGLGNFSNIDELPKQLTQMHLKFKPQTPKHDVTVMHHLLADIYTGGVKASKYVRVVAEIRQGAWSREERDELLKRMYDCIVRYRGSKADKIDIIVQAAEIEDEGTVIRNGRWGMWQTENHGATGSS